MQMAKPRRAPATTLLIVVLGIVGAACGGGGASADLSGAVNVDGSSTVFPITQALAEEFNKEAPSVDVAVGAKGTGGGFERFCNAETDVSDASRPIKDEEKAACQKKGVEYVELQIAIDGLSVVVNAQNDFVDYLTIEELKKIWEPGSTVTSWRQVRDGFPDKPLTREELFGPGTDSGTFDYFTDEIIGEEGASRDEYQASENDEDLVKGVAGNPNALGYFGYYYYRQNTDKLKVVPIDAGNGPIEPTEKTINTGTYAPLSRPLFIYVAKSAAAKPQVVAFVDFYIDNANELVGDVGYIQIPGDVLAEEQAEWEAFKA